MGKELSYLSPLFSCKHKTDKLLVPCGEKVRALEALPVIILPSSIQR